MIKAILAVGENGEIGQDGDMPWKRRLPKDLEYFKEVTSKGEVILMGSSTHRTLPFYPKGLPERYNYVLSNKQKGQQPSGVVKLPLTLFNSAYARGESIFNSRGVFIIGGASIYEQLWEMVDEVHLTRVKTTFPEADTHFTPDLDDFEKVGGDIDVSGDDLEAYVEVWRRVQ